MIQSHQQLLTTATEYNTLFSKNEFYPLQKAYTTPHFLVLGLRFPGRNVALYIGRGNQFEGIFISDKFPPSYLRVQDRLLDYIRKYLVGTRFGKMEVDEKHFMALFHFKNDHIDNSFLFGYKDRQLFFAKQNKEEIYTSWNGETSVGQSIPALVDNLLGERSTIDSGKNPSWSLLQYFTDEHKKISGQPIQKKKEKFLEKKLNNISKDLADVEKWQLIEDELLSEEEFDISKVNLYGHKLKLSPHLNDWQKRDAIFGKVKKLKKAEGILKSRLQEAGDELSKVRIGEFEYEVTKEKAIAPFWQSSPNPKVKHNAEYEIKNFKIKNLSGMISLDAASNDWLRSQGAKEHYWFHIEDYPGAHCLIKTDDISILSGEDLSAIASMLRDYSRLEISAIPVMYTQIKNVKGLKGAKGKVIVKKPKYLRCNYLPWKEIITIN